VPIYQFENLETNQIEDHMMSYTKYDEFVENNKHLRRIFNAPSFISGIDNRPDSGFREVLKNIKKNNIGSDINTHE
jgi:hypothetical protein